VPTPAAIEDLARSGGRLLVAGEDLDRLRALLEALLRVDCRVELVALPRARGEAPLQSDDYRLVVVDAIELSRASIANIHSSYASGASTPLLTITRRGATHYRIARAQDVHAVVSRDGCFADVARVARDILSLWSTVCPISGPGDLRIDRVAQRAALGGRPLGLTPLEFRLLRALAEAGVHGCTPDELRQAARARDTSAARDAEGVRQGIQRLRAAFRRRNVAVISTAGGAYCLTTKPATEPRQRGADRIHRQPDTRS
jgi:hypothetical protein